MTANRRVAILCFALMLPCAGVAAQSPKRPPARSSKPPAKKAPPPPTPPDAAPPPDLEIATAHTAGATTTTAVVRLSGARQRIDYEADLATIQQCDTGRSIELNQKTRTFLVAAAAAPPATAAQARTKGGRITYETIVTDTGETKPLFGFTAHHLRTSVVKRATAEACDQAPESVEVDGWYADLPSSLACTGTPTSTSEVRVDPKNGSCQDDVAIIRPARAPGYPLAYTMTTTAGNAAPAVTTMQVTRLERTTFQPQQFEVPADYLEVRSLAQLTADHRPGEVGPKKPGVPRVGVAPILGKGGSTATAAEITEALAESLGEVHPDVVLLHGDTSAAIDADASARSCDYVLQNTVADVKKPGRGMFGKVTGSSGDSFSAKVEFALTVPGQSKPAFTGSEHSGTSLLQTAVGAARRASQFFPPALIARYGYLNAFSAMGGAASPAALQQTSDPVLSTVFSLVARANRPRQQGTLTTEEAAIGAALEREVSDVVTQLQRRK